MLVCLILCTGWLVHVISCMKMHDLYCYNDVDLFLCARERVLSSAELDQASGLVDQNESSRLSEELSLEREQQ